MIIYSCLLISQDASATEDTSKVNLEKDVILPGINDIMPKRNGKDQETRSINNFLAFLLIGCLIAPNVAEIQ